MGTINIVNNYTYIISSQSGTCQLHVAIHYSLLSHGRCSTKSALAVERTWCAHMLCTFPYIIVGSHSLAIAYRIRPGSNFSGGSDPGTRRYVQTRVHGSQVKVQPGARLPNSINYGAGARGHYIPMTSA